MYFSLSSFVKVTRISGIFFTSVTNAFAVAELACTASRAFRAAIGRGGCVLRFFVFVLHKPLGYADIDEVPRKYFVDAHFAVCIECGVDAAIVEELDPFIVAEIFIPAVEPCAAVYSIFNNWAKSAVTTGKCAFQNGNFRFVPAEADLSGMDGTACHFLFC